MARGHQKIQSQQKNAKKQAEIKKSKGHDQKTARESGAGVQMWRLQGQWYIIAGYFYPNRSSLDVLFNQVSIPTYDRLRFLNLIVYTLDIYLNTAQRKEPMFSLNAVDVKLIL